MDNDTKNINICKCLMGNKTQEGKMLLCMYKEGRKKMGTMPPENAENMTVERTKRRLNNFGDTY